MIEDTYADEGGGQRTIGGPVRNHLKPFHR
jgi:hypothetical protein